MTGTFEKCWQHRKTMEPQFYVDQKEKKEKCPYSKLFWSVFPHMQTECGNILRISPSSVRRREIPISPYSVGMWENTNQNNSKYEHFSRSAKSKCYCFNHSRRSRIQKIFLVGQPWWLTILVSVPWLLSVGAPVVYIYYICI